MSYLNLLRNPNILRLNRYISFSCNFHKYYRFISINQNYNFRYFSDKTKTDDKPTLETKDSDSSQKQNTPPNQPYDPSIGLTLLVIFGGSLLLELLNSGFYRNEITFQEFFVKHLSLGHVEKIHVVNKEYAKCYIKNGKENKVVYFRIGSIDQFEIRMNQIQQSLGIHPDEYIPIQYVTGVNIIDELKKFIPFGLFFFLIALGFRKLMSKGPPGMDKFFKMGKAVTFQAKDLKVKTSFKDVAGMKEAKMEISEFVDFLKNPERFRKLGAKIPKGALLCGPPGTGKTLLAKAVAGEAQVPFFSISGSDFIEVFVGIGPSRVRDLFENARKNAPSIIFIDEIDAIGKKRARGGFAGGSNDERENTLNQILVEMDGFKSSSGVVVMAGTNRSDILDPALVRPGRFDRTINISKPDIEERYEIFKVHLKPIKFSDKTDVDDLARRMAALTPGFVGAEIANVINEAAIFAARRKAEDGVEMKDFDAAIERFIGGMVRSSNLLSDEQKRVIAYHETGHALTGWWLEYADPVLKVSIVPRSSGALGFSQQMPEDISLFSKEAILDKIAVILGGRAAEEIFIGKITTGATDDLNKVTKLCHSFVSQWGMNTRIGLVSYTNEGEHDFYRNYSESTAQMIDNEVKNIISTQYERVKKVLCDKADLVHKLSNLLYQKETITYHDIANCVGERPFPSNEKYKAFIEANPNKIEKN